MTLTSTPQSANDDPTFPCPVCLNTMVPGATHTPGKAKQGAGRVWVLDAGPPALVECTRCEGRGVLDNRRNRRDRRLGSRDRRD
ncbi:MAG TPA: hypothetical protein VIN56_10535 [Candidatus Dormibacteraeota bacterium]